MTVTDGGQLRAARAILGLTLQETADLAALSRKSVHWAENRNTLPRQARAAERICKAFEERGVVCETGQGGLAVRFASEAI